jgi:hypothetical protein
MSSAARPERSGERYPVQLKVAFERGEGLTRDVSARGVYFETERQFVAGAQIVCAIVFDTSAGPLHAICEGEVTRVDHRGSRLGVAASFRHVALSPVASFRELA